MSYYEARQVDMVAWLFLTYGHGAFVKAQTYDGKEVFFLFDLPDRRKLSEYLRQRDQVWDLINQIQDEYAIKQRNDK